MIGIRKMRGKYYARVYFKLDGDYKEKLYPLNTEYRTEAEKRRLEVDQNLSIIKSNEFIPSWKSESGLPTLKDANEYKLSQAKDDFLIFRESRFIRVGTLNLNEIGLRRFIEAVSDKLVSEITIDDIDLFIEYYSLKRERTLSPASINMDLRTLKVFFKWLKKREYINSIPEIEQLPITKQKPIYITNTEFETICSRVDIHFQRAFYFYRETGLRLSEPFDGEVNGEFLTIPADRSKSRNDHELFIPSVLMQILKEMRFMVDEKVNNGINTRETAVKFYSRVFRKACKGDMRKGIEPIKNRKFHSLRHTSAVRLYLKTRDIYAVMKQLGHQSVTTTEIYSKFEEKRLSQDFSDLVNKRTADPLKTGENGYLDTKYKKMPDTKIPAFA
jgi:integrase/recombinase XerD